MLFMQGPGRFFVIQRTRPLCDRMSFGKSDVVNSAEDLAMRRTIEIAAAALLLFCITAASAAAAGRIGHSADGLSCARMASQPTPRPRRAVPQSVASAAENLPPIIAAASCCRRCEPGRKRPPMAADPKGAGHAKLGRTSFRLLRLVGFIGFAFRQRQQGHKNELRTT